MEKRRIPNTELDVSVICLGTMTFGTPVGESEAIAITRWAIDNEMNFIDTANIYEGYTRRIGSAGGKAEEFLGKALANGYRDRAVIATKVGNKVGPEREDDGTSPAAIRKQLDASLKRLRMDSVDIYYLHKPDVHETPLVEIIGELRAQMDAGKFRYYGISNYSAEQTAELLKVADENNLPRPVIHQARYSLVYRGAEEDLLPLCEKEGIGVAPYQILQGGLLTGKYHRGQTPPANSRKVESKWLDYVTEEMLDDVERVRTLAKEKGRTMLQHTVLSTLAKPAVVSAVMGVKRIDQIEELVSIIK